MWVQTFSEEGTLTARVLHKCRQMVEARHGLHILISWKGQEKKKLVCDFQGTLVLNMWADLYFSNYWNFSAETKTL